METCTFLKGRQNNKLYSFKKFDFSNRTKKVGQKEYILGHNLALFFLKHIKILVDRELNVY